MTYATTDFNATNKRTAFYDEAALIRTMLPAIREEFRALLPDTKTPDTGMADLQDQVRKITLGAALSKAQVIGKVIGLIDPDDCYHILGTTRAIYNDLHAFYENNGFNDRKDRAKALSERQGALYAVMQSFKFHDTEPSFVETQLIIGRYVKDIVPPERKPPVQGFGC
jgi:hypothetical protein